MDEAKDYAEDIAAGAGWWNRGGWADDTNEKPEEPSDKPPRPTREVRKTGAARRCSTTVPASRSRRAGTSPANGSST